MSSLQERIDLTIQLMEEEGFTGLEIADAVKHLTASEEVSWEDFE